MFDWRSWSERKARAREAEKLANWQRALAALPPDGDLTSFFAPEVPEEVRQEALQRLWSRGFGTPDGLDSEFVDAASHPLLTEAEARSLVQWQQVVVQPTTVSRAEDGLPASGPAEEGAPPYDGKGGVEETSQRAAEGLASGRSSGPSAENDGHTHLPAYDFLKHKEI